MIYLSYLLQVVTRQSRIELLGACSDPYIIVCIYFQKKKKKKMCEAWLCMRILVIYCAITENDVEVARHIM